jgi:hypothetical protein
MSTFQSSGQLPVNNAGYNAYEPKLIDKTSIGYVTHPTLNYSPVGGPTAQKPKRIVHWVISISTLLVLSCVYLGVSIWLY